MRYDGNALGFGASGGEEGIAVYEAAKLVCLAVCTNRRNE